MVIKFKVDAKLKKMQNKSQPSFKNGSKIQNNHQINNFCYIVLFKYPHFGIIFMSIKFMGHDNIERARIEYKKYRNKLILGLKNFIMLRKNWNNFAK